MVEIKLNDEGIRELLKSDEIFNECIQVATEIQKRAGEHYKIAERKHYKDNSRYGVVVFPADRQGERDNLKNNTLLKAMKG